MREVVDLPADDSALDLDAQREREQRNDVAAKIRDAERRVRVGLAVRCRYQRRTTPTPKK